MAPRVWERLSLDVLSKIWTYAPNVKNPMDENLANAARRPGAKRTCVGPGCVRVRTPDDREWHQAHRRPNRPNPNRFNKPGIRPIRKM